MKIMLSEASEENEAARIQKWMKISLGFAEKALKNGEVPIGCIFIYNNEIIATGANTVNETKNATRHAEINCIDDVLKWCRARNLNYYAVFKEVEVVVTVEPCIMCSAALHEMNIKQIIYGCFNYRFGGCSTVFDVPLIYSNSTCKVQSAVLAEKAVDLLKEFYKGTNPNAPKNKVINADNNNKKYDRESIANRSLSGAEENLLKKSVSWADDKVLVEMHEIEVHRRKNIFCKIFCCSSKTKDIKKCETGFDNNNS